MKSIKLISLDLEEGEGLLLLGDTHIGHERHNSTGLLDTLAKSVDNGDKILLMGDLSDYGLANSVGASVYEQDIQPQEQYEEVLRWLEPHKDQIIGSITGNHEERVRKNTGIDIGKNLARELGVPYFGYGGVVRISVDNTSYLMYAKHGGSGAATRGGKINAVMKFRNIFPGADIYAMGHVHDLAHEFMPVRYYDSRNKSIKSTTQHFVLTGYYMEYEDGYGEQKDYAPGSQGSPRIVFHKNKEDLAVEFYRV
jgi:hypothetical protein